MGAPAHTTAVQIAILPSEMRRQAVDDMPLPTRRVESSDAPPSPPSEEDEDAPLLDRTWEHTAAAAAREGERLRQLAEGDARLSKLASLPPPPPWSLWDYAIDVLLLAAACGCIWLLWMMARDVMIFIVCGLLFMGSAAFTIVQAQFAERSAARLAWFVATGCVLFLFAYWALTVVFRPPDMKETVGCGGVKFVGHDEL